MGNWVDCSGGMRLVGCEHFETFVERFGAGGRIPVNISEGGPIWGMVHVVARGRKIVAAVVWGGDGGHVSSGFEVVGR